MFIFLVGFDFLSFSIVCVFNLFLIRFLVMCMFLKVFLFMKMVFGVFFEGYFVGSGDRI